MVTDQKFRIRYASSAVIKALGVEIMTLVGKDILEFIDRDKLQHLDRQP
ncbi:hypothetical protein [Ohtaekwangia sp.]